MTRSLLFVTQVFPPASGSGVQRGAKLVKYLMRAGWDVRVATIDPTGWPDQDPTLVRDVEGAHVRAATRARIPGVHHIAARATPDLVRGVRALLTSTQGAKPDAMLMTSPDVHWFPLARAARKAGVPYVLDYPDPWTVLPDDLRIFKPSKLRSRLKWAFAPRLERSVVAGAAAATFATQPILDAYVDRFRGLRGHLLTNGFDPEDFPPGEEAERPSASRLRLVHVGSFAGARQPTPAARVLRAVVDRLDLAPSSAELVLVGAGAQGRADALSSELGSIPLRVIAWCSHAEAIDRMRSADVLWLDAMPHLRSAATGKIFEYLAAGRPIVGLAHPASPATGLVRTFAAGALAPDEPGAVDALARMVSDGILDTVNRIDDLGEFDRRRLASTMDGLLREVAG